MTTPTFFPGHLALIKSATITVSNENAKAIKDSVASDLSTMKAQPFHMWRALISSRYAADPIVTFLLTELENHHNNKTSNWNSIFS